MSEVARQLDIQEGEITDSLELEAEECLGWKIIYTDTAAQEFLKADIGKRTIHANLHGKEDVQGVRFAAITEATRWASYSRVFARTPMKALAQEIKNDPLALAELSLLEGLGMVRAGNERLRRELLSLMPASGSLKSEFMNACRLRILTGEFPKVSPEVEGLLKAMPVSPAGEHMLDLISAGTKTYAVRKKWYDEFIAPAAAALAERDAALHTTDIETFTPSTDDSELEKLEEGDIEKRIEPYIGGYFRTKVFRPDWNTMQMQSMGQARKVTQDTFNEQIAGEAANYWNTAPQYVFRGSIGPTTLAFEGTEIRLSAPARALFDPETFVGPEGAELRQDEYGCYLLKLPESFDVLAAMDEAPLSYACTFVLTQRTPAWMKEPPTDDDISIPDDIKATFSTETRTFLEELASLKITSEAKALRVARRVREMIEYVNDSEVGMRLTAAGRGYFQELETLKKGDCDVSNFYALAQLRALGIAARMTGDYFIKRDRRFDFAAIAGQRHAWLEYWNSEERVWKRLDATPPKKDEDEDEEEDENPTENTGGDRAENKIDSGLEVGDADPDDSREADEWTEERLEKLRESLKEAAGELGGGESEVLQRTKQEFLEKEGVTMAEWDAVREYAKKIDATPVPRKETYAAEGDSTIGEEWEKLYQDIIVSYKRHKPGLRTLTTRNQGEELTDPVTAGIDIMSGEEDPYGWTLTKKGQKTERLPIWFSNDALLDLTASMEAKDDFGVSLKESQKRFIMTGLYHSYLLNERVRQRAADLEVVPQVTNHLITIHGQMSHVHLTQGAEATSVKRMVELFRQLDTTKAGSGNIRDALREYRAGLLDDPITLSRIKAGEMLKSLTVISDGNMWCSVCQAEACGIAHDMNYLNQTKQEVAALRELGVKVFGIGFTRKSKPITELMADAKDPDAAQVLRDTTHAIAAHHGQIVRAFKPIRAAAARRLESEARMRTKR